MAATLVGERAFERLVLRFLRVMVDVGPTSPHAWAQHLDWGDVQRRADRIEARLRTEGGLIPQR